MKLKQIIILSAVLALLVVGVIYKNSQRPVELTTQEYTPLDLSFEAEKVSKIITSRKISSGEEKGESKVEIIKGAAGWQVKSLFGARGDSVKIQALLDKIKNAEGELRGEGKELFSDFSITDDDAFHVALWDSSGNEILNIAIGSKKSGQSVFVRKKGSDKIHLSSTDLLSALGFFGDVEKETPKSEYWASNEYLFFDAAKANKISVSRFENGVETVSALVVKENGKWKYPADKYPAALDPDKVSKHLESMKAWRANKVLDPKAKDYGFATPRGMIRVGVEEGPETVVTIGAEDTENSMYYLQAAGEPVVYEIAKYFVENLDIDDSKFFKEPILGEVNIKNAEALKVSSGKESYSVKPIEKNWDALDNYLKDLSSFRISKLVTDPKEQKNFSAKSSLEIKKKDEPLQVFEFGDLLPGAKEVMAKRKDNPYIFTVSEAFYKNMFESAGRLKEPEPSKPAAAPAA